MLAARLARRVKCRTTLFIEWQDLQATVYGDVAVSTGYLVGTWTIGDSTREGTWRETIVWLRQGQGWQVAHLHVSECLA